MHNIAQKVKKLNSLAKGKFKGLFNGVNVNYENDILEVIFINNFERFKDMQSKLNNKKLTCTDEEKIRINQRISASRARCKIKRLILANDLGFHYCTTYSDDVENREKALKDTNLFMKRLSYKLRFKIPYVAVFEIQEERFKSTGKKVFHTHIAIGQDIPIKSFWVAWNSLKCENCNKYQKKRSHFKCKECKDFKGVVWKVDKDFDVIKVANYFGKYFSKGFNEKDLNTRVANQKRYLSSKGLKMPKIEKVFIDDDTRLKIEKYCSMSIPGRYHKKFDDGGSYNLLETDVLEMFLKKEV